MLFKRNDTLKLTKSVTVYISDLHHQIIIAPLYINDAGIVYEQDTCTILNYPTDYLTLGDEVLRNFHLFSRKDKNLKDQKASDWPAFKHSTLKSIKQFESGFMSIDVCGNNESNSIIYIEAQIVGDNDLIIKSTISAHANKDEIGKLILKVNAKALSTT